MEKTPHAAGFGPCDQLARLRRLTVGLAYLILALTPARIGD